MKLAEAKLLMYCWEKEVAHAEFRYLADFQVKAITEALSDQLTQRWKADTPPYLRCPSCGRCGFKTREVYNAVSDTARLKCSKCGQWGGVMEWDEKTKQVKPLAGDRWDDDYDDECDPEPDCLICCGEGFIEGDDPLWDEGDYVKCYSCGGSGLRKDMTVW